MSEKAADMQSLAKKFNQSRERLRQIQKTWCQKSNTGSELDSGRKQRKEYK